MTKREKQTEIMRKLSKEQLNNQMAWAKKEVARLEKLEKEYKEQNEKDPHLKYYNLEPYRVWQKLIYQINDMKELLEIGERVLKEKVSA